MKWLVIALLVMAVTWAARRQEAKDAEKQKKLPKAPPPADDA